jgi:teichuronic acid biosynthesis glycosyltransferase TuaC
MLSVDNPNQSMRLNILAVSYLFPNRAQPGYGIFVLNRLRAVAAFCNIKVIAPVQWYPFIHRLRRLFLSEAVPAHEQQGSIDVYHPRFAVIPRYFKWFDALSFLWSTRSIARKLRKESFEYDLVDVHWTYPDIVAGWFLARIARKKYVVTIRGHEAFYDTEVSIRRWLVAHFLRRADFVIALSEELRQKAIALGVRSERTRVILNGVDLSHFGFMEKHAARQQLGIDANRRLLLSVGRLTAGKGHDVLVRMMAELSHAHDAELVIIGGVNPEDDFGDTLRALIADLQLKNVRLVEKVPHEQLGVWYAAADVFCLASKGEGCPNVVLEALACGAPVVMTRVGAVEQIIQSGINGLLVEPAAVDSFGTVVDQCLRQDWDRKRIADEMHGWSWTSCAEKVLAVYRTVLQSECHLPGESRVSNEQ